VNIVVRPPKILGSLALLFEIDVVLRIRKDMRFTYQTE